MLQCLREDYHMIVISKPDIDASIKFGVDKIYTSATETEKNIAIDFLKDKVSRMILLEVRSHTLELPNTLPRKGLTSYIHIIISDEIMSNINFVGPC